MTKRLRRLHVHCRSTGLSALMSEKSVVQFSDFYTSNYEAKHLLATTEST